MNPPDIQVRIKRLLNGEGSTQDLSRLVLWLRAQAGRRYSCVRDFGDFVAHADERDMGLTWEKARDFSHMFRHTMAKIGRTPMTRTIFVNGTSAYFRTMSQRDAKKNLGIGLKSARRTLERGLGKFGDYQDGAWIFHDVFDEIEERVVTHCSSYFNCEPFIDGNELMRQMADCLIELGLLESAERDAFMALKPSILLFAIASMHGAIIKDGDEELGSMLVGIHEGNVALYMAIPMDQHQVRNRIFCTDLPWAEHCTFEPKPMGDPEIRLELTPDRRLSVVS